MGKKRERTGSKPTRYFDYFSGLFRTGHALFDQFLRWAVKI